MPLNERETFRKIPNWPGYMVGNFGTVVSCRTNGGKTNGIYRKKVPSLDADGYLRLKLHNNGEVVFIGVHALVLLAFVGDRPEGCFALHKNGDRSNNRLENLYWGTPQQNADDREKHGNTARHERGGNSKIDRVVVEIILNLRQLGLPFENIGWAVGLSKRQIMRICKRENWRGIFEPPIASDAATDVKS